MASHTPGAPVFAPPADLPEWALRSVDLASPRLGATALFASDDFFAEVARMLNPEPAQFVPGKFDTNGKWMDGWESRRKRVAGHDWALVKLGVKGVIRGFDVDTSHFTGNYPPAVSIEATVSASDDVEALKGAGWTEILPATALGPSSHHLIECASTQAWTHLRVNIFPDGGIARLRVYGRPVGSLEALGPDAVIDLVAMENGGRAVSWNDASFGSSVAALMLPGRGQNMGDGWETRRRREPGNDWCVLELGAPGTVERIEVDTAFFKGNYPDRCSIQAAYVTGGTDRSITTQSMFWQTLLPEQKLQMDAVHSFSDEIARLGPITHVRFNIFPDGGVSRLRLWGKVNKKGA
ncbi:allantoicase [Zoogloea sp.]|jgi:allantoicase|uniref:allantoicase n=1 Tax=Zoogloea sp. TaxID=49181 RepID=UPI0011D37300|nr:allantoicase [Zoogloea sp.]MBK6655953.1 allantoicase [Zoogloea sp.]MBP7444145.1 allantoicase [Zoogloea sp.]TXG95946.1 MAG: allantoicase [Zoogloea sp.]HOY01264.1 allantoicase [Zoogloea sp.]HPI62113.1 allantoicase [Zoogloea sp.]